MCQECGCEDEGRIESLDTGKSRTIPINKPVMQANDMMAQEIRNYLKEKKVFCINIEGSPGSGKTSVIECLAKSIPASTIAVIQGDLESDVDKVRLEKAGIYTYQINTHSGCHLNAMMINRALLDMKLDGKKYLLIENVGNLVCPAGVQIGQAMNMVVSSVTEGSDKPRKYPYIFMDADVVIISKYDIAKMVDFEESKYIEDITHINSHTPIIRVSTKDAESFKIVAEFIEHRKAHFLGEGHEHRHTHTHGPSGHDEGHEHDTKNPKEHTHVDGDEDFEIAKEYPHSHSHEDEYFDKH